MNKFSESIINAWRRASLSPKAVADDLGRSRDRAQRVAFTFLASLGARVITVLTNLVMVPLLVSYLGEERYGVWLTLNSFVAYLAFADLGLGNGLLNAVSEAHAHDDKELARQILARFGFRVAGEL